MPHVCISLCYLHQQHCMPYLFNGLSFRHKLRVFDELSSWHLPRSLKYDMLKLHFALPELQYYRDELHELRESLLLLLKPVRRKLSSPHVP